MGKLRARLAAAQIEKRTEAPVLIVGRIITAVMLAKIRTFVLLASMSALLLIWSVALPTTGLLYILGYLR